MYLLYFDDFVSEILESKNSTKSLTNDKTTGLSHTNRSDNPTMTSMSSANTMNTRSTRFKGKHDSTRTKDTYEPEKIQKKLMRRAKRKSIRYKK